MWRSGTEANDMTKVSWDFLVLLSPRTWKRNVSGNDMYDRNIINALDGCTVSYYLCNTSEPWDVVEHPWTWSVISVSSPLSLMEKPLVSTFLDESASWRHYVPFVIMVEDWRVVPFSQRSEDVSVSVGERTYESVSYQPSSFCRSMLVWPTDVGIPLDKCSIISLLGNTGSIRVTDICGWDGLEANLACVDLY
jgi:hypothetical protein